MNTRNNWIRVPTLLAAFALSCGLTKVTTSGKKEALPNFSGIYPHLAYYNQENECGTGAVVPWAGNLWVITYGPHLPNGSTDKLYQITPDLQQIIREESIGGTPANRMIHRESDQLFIGPYAIDANGKVRTIPYAEMPGRHTGNARHLTDPAQKIYYGTMEEGFYEVDVKSLEVRMLYEDGNTKHEKGADLSANQSTALLEGAHGKGLYSGQGVLVYSNNGESGPQAQQQFDIPAGSLSEWDGESWKLVRRNQFVEVTGPGGIYGNEDPANDPIWATGWDHKSVILGARYRGAWTFYRLPKASHSYDGAHGWNTEWPRIRNIGTTGRPDYLMTMHGMFWRFPRDFRPGRAAGIRPRSAYLKVIGDFARWNDQLVFGCDDSAKAEFLNKRKAKGQIEGAGQSNSNLWFTAVEQPDRLGPTTAEGAVWLNEPVTAGQASEPFLFAGWTYRTAWLHNAGPNRVNLSFETDPSGKGEWKKTTEVELDPGASLPLAFAPNTPGEWIRVLSDRAATVTVHFFYGDEDNRPSQPDDIFNGLAGVEQNKVLGGLLHQLGDNRRALGIAPTRFDGVRAIPIGYYELDGNMRLVRKPDINTEDFIRKNYTIPQDVIKVEESSVLVIDDQGRRWRLPLGNNAYAGLTEAAALRIAREVATERDLLSCHGTFYELPAENADGFAKIRPVSSHNFRIHDYASHRGMLILTGIDPNRTENNPHIVVSDDGRAAVWAGVIDDLWKMGKPVGRGGPWKHSQVRAGEASDPYLIGFYDKKTLTLSHDHPEAVTFTVEAEPVGHGPWMKVTDLTVPAGKSLEYVFPAGFQARWVRFKSVKDCKATAWLVYE